VWSSTHLTFLNVSFPLCSPIPRLLSEWEDTTLLFLLFFFSSFLPVAVEYLSRFLVLDSDQRISMAEAMEHPWILEGFGSPVETHLPPRPKMIPEPQPDVFSQLLEYGYTEKEARLALVNMNQNPIKNTYFLLLEKKSREQKAASEPTTRERFSFSNLINHSLKSKKNKFDKDGFLLDVTYITDQLIRMSHPGEAMGSLFVNPIKEVQRFFERYHKDHYRIYNLTPTEFSSYHPEKFNNMVSRFGVRDDAMPSVHTLHAICTDMDEFLTKSPDNVVAVHGKQDLLRPAVAISTYLIHSHMYDTVHDVISYFTDKMYPIDDKPTKSLFSASAKRYLQYYLKYRDLGFVMPKERILCISTIELNSIPQFDVYGGCDPFVKIKMNGPVMVNVKKTDPIRHFSSKKDSSIKISCDTVPMSGDIQISVLDRVCPALLPPSAYYLHGPVFLDTTFFPHLLSRIPCMPRRCFLFVCTCLSSKNSTPSFQERRTRKLTRRTRTSPTLWW